MEFTPFPLAAFLVVGWTLGCRSPEVVDPRIVRAEASTRAESWGAAASLWGDIYRDSRGEDRRAGLASAQALAEIGQPGVARTRLMELEQRWPDDPEILERLGAAHERIGDPEAARAAYMRALQREPDRPQALARLGVLTGDAGLPGGGDSLGRLETSQGIDRIDPLSLFELAEGAARSGRFDQAYRAFSAALERGEFGLESRLRAARLLSPDPRVIPWLVSIVRSDPLHTSALTLLGTVQLSAGRGQAALGTLEQAASSDPSDEEALRAFAAALTQAGQSGRAVEILEGLGGDPTRSP